MENSLSVLRTHRLISLSVLAEMEITRISSSLFIFQMLVCLFGPKQGSIFFYRFREATSYKTIAQTVL